MPATQARIVRIELPGDDRILSLAEVEVFADGINVAEKQKASASSEVFGALSARAVDGNTDGNYNNGSVTHTAKSSNPWWEVDLGRAVKVEKIIVYNRSGSLGVKLDGFTLQMMDENRKVVFSKENCTQDEKITFLPPGVKSSSGGAPQKAGVAANLKSDVSPSFAGSFEWHGKALSDTPNVIFVLADDERLDSLTLTGAPPENTPNLDQLAKEGVFFRNAFVTSPICGPSRANLFTSQWERRNHIGFADVSKNYVTQEAFDNSFLMQLKRAGYSTAFIGKHHTKIVDRGNTPLKQNIDFCYYGEGHLGFYPADKGKTFTNLKNKSQIEGLFEAFEAYLKPGNEFDYFYENADASIKNQLNRRDPNKPFCAWINFNLPHQASLGGMGSRPDDPSFYSTLYKGQPNLFAVPEGYPDNLTLPSNVITRDEQPGYYKFTTASLLVNKLQTARAVYGIDQFIGNLRDMLVDLKLDQNTIIVFFSDNGLMYGEHGLGGKTMLYEESVHVPLIVYSPFLPKKERGTQRSELVVGQDIPATLLDLCGLAVPGTYQGESMLPLMEGKTVDWRKEVFLENLFTDQGYARQDGVRSERYKYIRYYSKENDRNAYLPDGVEGEQPIYEELFDMEADPKEQRNLATNPEYASVLQAQRARCAELDATLSR
jgi:arylsulfatase A-like enzyme